MSASRERKKRMEQGTVPASVPQKKKKKLSEGWILAICVVLIVALVFGGVLGFRAYQHNRTVLTVGNHDVTVSEFNFFYYNRAYSVASYASTFGIDTSVSLKEQNVTTDNLMYLPYMGYDTSYFKDYTANDEGVYEDVTWAQYLSALTKDTIVQAYAIYNEAMAAGYTLDADDQKEIDDEIAALELQAATQGESLDGMLSRVFGSGCDEDGYRNYMTVIHVASHYPETLKYTDEQIAARYEESPEDFDIVSFYLYTTKASDYAEKDEEGNTAEPTEENEAEAKENAERMAADFRAMNDDVRVCADYTKSTVTNAYGEEAAAWLFDTASLDGENVKLFEKDGTYYVIKLAAKGDYQSYNAIELFIENDSEEVAEGEMTAERKIAAISAAMKRDHSEENMKAMVETYGDGSNGVVENMMRSSMSSVDKSVFNWGLESHKAGDFSSFITDNGTMFLFITGEGETKTNYSVSNTITSEWLEELYEAALASCNYDEDAAMAGNVGLFR